MPATVNVPLVDGKARVDATFSVPAARFWLAPVTVVVAGGAFTVVDVVTVTVALSAAVPLQPVDPGDHAGHVRHARRRELVAARAGEPVDRERAAEPGRSRGSSSPSACRSCRSRVWAPFTVVVGAIDFVSWK